MARAKRHFLPCYVDRINELMEASIKRVKNRIAQARWQTKHQINQSQQLHPPDGVTLALHTTGDVDL